MLQGQYAKIFAINRNKDKEGNLTKKYWGELSGKNRERMTFHLGQKQINSLVEQYGLSSWEELKEKAIVFDTKEEKDDKKDVTSFVSNGYYDQDGALQKRDSEVLIIRGLVHSASRFDEDMHERCDFSRIARHEEEPMPAEETTTPAKTAKTRSIAKAVSGDLVAA